MLEIQFNFWTLDFTTDLPASGLFYELMVYINKLTKLVRLVPYLVGHGELAALNISQ